MALLSAASLIWNHDILLYQKFSGFLQVMDAFLCSFLLLDIFPIDVKYLAPVTKKSAEISLYQVMLFLLNSLTTFSKTLVDKFPTKGQASPKEDTSLCSKLKQHGMLASLWQLIHIGFTLSFHSSCPMDLASSILVQ